MLLRVVLVADNDALARLKRLVQGPDVVVDSVRGSRRSLERVARKAADVLIAAESVLPRPPENAVNFLRKLPEAPAIVVLSDTEDPEQHAALLAAGCDMVLFSGLADETLREALHTAFHRRETLTDQAILARRPIARPQLSDFVSDSLSMQSFMQIVRRMVKSDTSLLILGETGVGKERLARAIHEEGPRSGGPFIAVNCGALPETLLESELFGHEEGAFTGATRSRRGAFELAHGGAIFLDEIAELPLHLQVNLLRVLQDHEVQRVGGEKPIKLDVRVIAASNRDLDEEVEAQQFRKDLYYRISVVSLVVPPLRERIEDIPSLAQSYIDYLRTRIGCRVFAIDDNAIAALCRYSWPGNVRELINVVERAMLLCDGEEITLADLPHAITQPRVRDKERSLPASIPRDADSVPDDWLGRPLEEIRESIVKDVEQAYLTALLRKTGGRVGKTATMAGIQPRSLYDKMKRYGLRKEDFRSSDMA